MQNSLAALVHAQKLAFAGGATRCINVRITHLRALKKLLVSNEKLLLDALHKDLGKAAFEAYTTEFYPLLQEIDYAIKNILLWSQPRTVKTSWFVQPAHSYQYPEPY